MAYYTGPDTFDYRLYDDEFKSEPAGDLMFGIPAATWFNMSATDQDAHFIRYMDGEGIPMSGVDTYVKTDGLVYGVGWSDWNRMSAAEKTIQSVKYNRERAQSATTATVTNVVPFRAAEAISEPVVETPRLFTREAMDRSAAQFLTDVSEHHDIASIPVDTLACYILNAAGVDRLLAAIYGPAADRHTEGEATQSVRTLVALNTALQKKLEHFDEIKAEHTDFKNILTDNHLAEKCKTHDRWHTTWGHCPECGDTSGAA